MTVGPKEEFAEAYLNPMHDHAKESDDAQADENTAEPDSWDAMAQKCEELETRLAEQFENEDKEEPEAPPRVKAPREANKGGMATPPSDAHALCRIVSTLRSSKKRTQDAPSTRKEKQGSARHRKELWANQGVNGRYVSP